MVFKQSHLFRLCVQSGWNPLFLVETDDKADSIQHHIHREIEVALASQRHQMVEDMLSYLGEHETISWAQELRETYADALKCVPPFLPDGQSTAFSRTQSLGILNQCLNYFGVEPKWIDSDSKDDLAKQCGREMKHLGSIKRHEVVVQLGGLAEKLLLRHALVDVNLRNSNQEIVRANTLVILAAIKDSSNRSRSDYEAAILDAWLADPDCSEYLELLRKVVSYKLRKKSSLDRLDAFEAERVDHAINQRLWRRLEKSNEPSAI